MKEIYIRKMKYDEARYKLEREIHDAFMAGEKEVDIVHGIGEGILKKMVAEFVQQNDFLQLNESFLYTNPGATRVEITGPDKQLLKKYL